MDQHPRLRARRHPQGSSGARSARWRGAHRPARRRGRPGRGVPVGRLQGVGGDGAARPRASRSQYGGAGADHVTQAIMVEELARACASTSVTMLISKLGMMPIFNWGSEDAEAEVRPPGGVGRGPGQLLPVGGRRRQRRGGDAVPGRARRRPLRAVGDEVLDHQRRCLGHLHRVRQDRPRRRPPGHQLLRGRGRLGREGRQARAQDGVAGQPDRRGRLRRRPGARREPGRRRGPGLHHRHAHPRPQPAHHRRPGRGHRPGRHRLRGALHDAAQGLRSAHRRVPGTAVHAGRHGDADRGGPHVSSTAPARSSTAEIPTTSSR